MKLNLPTIGLLVCIALSLLSVASCASIPVPAAAIYPEPLLSGRDAGHAHEDKTEDTSSIANIWSRSMEVVDILVKRMPAPWMIGGNGELLNPDFAGYGHRGKKKAHGSKKKYLDQKREGVVAKKRQWGFDDYLAQSWAMKNKHTNEKTHRGGHRVEHHLDKGDSGRAQFQREVGHEEDGKLLV